MTRTRWLANAAGIALLVAAFSAYVYFFQAATSAY